MHSPRAMPPRRNKPGAGAALESSEAIAARVEEMERKVERLRSLYESFFLGVERRPPQVPRQELNRLMLEMQQVAIRNVALRFRFQTLSQRWTLLTTYWNRTLREIESGTYRRDLQKAYRRIAARGAPLTEAEAGALGIPAARAQAFVAQQNRRWGGSARGEASQATAAPATATAPVATAVPAPTAATAPAVSSGTHAPPSIDLAELHRAYAEAHVRLALPGAPPTAERLRDKVLPRLESLRAGDPNARVQVAVVTENGRIVIRAKPIR